MTDPLLSRLKALTGPDREIDAEIALANGWTEQAIRLWRIAPGMHEGPPRYTASIDAAMTLVPDDYYWFLCAGKTRLDEPLYGAQIEPAVIDGADRKQPAGKAESDAGAAIALLIAIMEAKEAAKQDQS